MEREIKVDARNHAFLKVKAIIDGDSHLGKIEMECWTDQSKAREKKSEGRSKIISVHK